MLLVGRYGVSIYGAMAYSAKCVELLRRLDFGLRMMACAVAGLSCAVYCAYANDDLCELLERTVARANDAMDERTPISRVGSMLAALVELNRGVLAHTLQLDRYRLWSELATVWYGACSLRHTLRLIARGEVRTLTGSMLRWLESHTGLLHQLRCMWHALSETVGDVMHEASSMVQHVAQSLATHLSGGWQMLAHWATRAMRGAVTASSRLASHSEVSSIEGH